MSTSFRKIEVFLHKVCSLTRHQHDDIPGLGLGFCVLGQSLYGWLYGCKRCVLRFDYCTSVNIQHDATRHATLWCPDGPSALQYTLVKRTSAQAFPQIGCVSLETTKHKSERTIHCVGDLPISMDRHRKHTMPKPLGLDLAAKRQRKRSDYTFHEDYRTRW